MLNQNSIWRYLLVIIVLGVSMLYALPNLYPNDPSLQINATRGADVTQQTVEQLQKAFTQQGLTPKSAVLEKGQVLVRFLNTEDQLKAREVANDILGDNFVTALNLAPATPAWLDAIGAAPNEIGSGFTWWCAFPDGSGHENCDGKKRQRFSAALPHRFT